MMRWVKGFPGHHSALNSFIFSCFSGKMYTVPNKTRAFLFQRAGFFYYVRRVPSQLQHHFNTGRIVFSLKTKSKNAALLRSSEISSRLETYWFHLRMRDDAVFARFLNQPSITKTIVDAVKLDEAVGQFLTNSLFWLCYLKHPTLQHR